ncbi:MAG TPA: glycosyltransferase family 2 protein [Candidatus Dormibacteraeota bacterium]|nr:glycosyltransferase family 2 protein [Candidatus Dormibacteraeota bacterium]
MFKGCRVGVVVPAYNEETQIDCVLETMPQFVDRIFVVDDCSRDATSDRVNAWARKPGSRVELLRHEVRRGPGASVSDGYKAALAADMELVATMDGDGQMDPQELHLVVEPVAAGKVAYAKGNRLTNRIAWQHTPHMRYLGNAFLSLLTKMASGYWHIADTQSGFTAISAAALRAIDLDRVYARYGYPNDILIKLNVHNLHVVNVPITPRYRVGERSSMKMWKVIPTVSFLLLRGFIYRMFEKYVIRDFHPLVFFYGLGFVLTVIGFALGLQYTILKITTGYIAVATIVLVALLLISGLQLLMFAMWFDMDYNKELR